MPEHMLSDRKKIKSNVTIIAAVFISMNSALLHSDIDQIQRLTANGSLDEALSLTNQELVKDQSNVTYRFLKGLILTRMGNIEEASDLFIEMTQSNPDLPEPYNNLAVIYASMGDYDKARALLEQAINTHPAYATAHENIGDIYAKLASQAYNQAFELDRENNTAKAKLSLVNELFSQPVTTEPVILAELDIQTQDSIVQQTPVVVPEPAPEVLAESSVQTQDSIVQQTPVVVPEPAPEVFAESDVQTQESDVREVPVTMSEPVPDILGESSDIQSQESSVQEVQVAMSEPDPVPQDTLSASAQQQKLEPDVVDVIVPVRQQQLANLNQETQLSVSLVKQTVLDWAAAWTQQNVDAYLEYYAGDFSPDDGSSLEQWREYRRERLTAPLSIQVSVSDLVVDMLESDHAQVTFTQIYESPTYGDRVKKNMLIKLEQNGWRISQEQTR